MKSNKMFIGTILVSLLSLASCNTPISNSSSSSDDSSSLVSESSSSSEEVLYQRVNYSNPIKYLKQDDSTYFTTTADPDILRGDDGYFYMYPTNAEVEMGSKGIQFDRGPIFRSKDLTSWKWFGSVFDGQTSDVLAWGTPGAGVWAPSVIKIGEQYNYYYSLSTWGDANPGVGVATSPTPYGPWTHHGEVIDSETSGVKNSIDPQAIIDDDSVYLIWGSFFGIAIIQLTDDGLEPFYGEYVKDYLKWIVPDNSGGKMILDKNYEGSYIIEREGYYYYFGSQGTCCNGVESTYRVKVGKADNLFGPYVAKDGIDMASGNYGELVIQPSADVAGVGHNAVLQDYAGDYWLIYHGFDINGDNPTERTILMDKLLWDEEGYPYVENKIPSYHQEKVGPLTRK